MRNVIPIEPDANDCRLFELAPTPNEYTTAFHVVYKSPEALALEAVDAIAVLVVVTAIGNRRKLAERFDGTMNATPPDVD